MSFPFPVATIPDLPNNATPPTTSLLEISNSGVSENTSIQDMLDTAGVEFQSNKGAVSGYAGLSATQELLLANFPSGTALQILRRNAANNALEFVTGSPLTTKGDLFTYDTDNQRLPVGADGQILSANSAQATGLEWINQPVTGLVSINADTTAAQILAGTTNRITILDAGATHTFDIGTDVVTLSDTQTLLNKTIDAASNTITNLTNSSLQTGIFAAITGVGVQTQKLNMGNLTIEAVDTPVNGTDAANKTYVDNLVNGLSWKNPARLATTGDITLSGNQSIDGFLTVDDDRVLVKDQSDDTENGVYAANSGAWTRTADTDEGDELVNMSIYITAGTVNEDTSWVQTTDPPITVGVTSIVYAQVGAGTGNPLTTKGDIFGYDTANARIPVGADGLVLTANSAVGLGVDYQTKEFTGTRTADIPMGGFDIDNVEEITLNNAGNFINSGAGGMQFGTAVNDGFFFAANFFTILEVSKGFANFNGQNATVMFELEANHSTPATGQVIAELNFIDDDSIASPTQYAGFEAKIFDPTNASEDGELFVNVRRAGTLIPYVSYNEGGLDVIKFGRNTNYDGFDLEGLATLTFDNTDNFITAGGNFVMHLGSGSLFQIEFDGFTKAFSFDETEFGLDNTNIVDVFNVTLNSGGKLTVNSDASEAGFRDVGHTADPAGPAAGDLYYNTTSNTFRFYNGAIWGALGGGGAQTPITSDIDYDGFDIQDLSNIQFRNTTGAPAAGNNIFVTGGAMTFDVLGNTDTFQLRIGAGQTLFWEFKNNTLDMFGNGLTNPGNFLDVNSNELLTWASVASAVNGFTITNAATGNDPIFAVGAFGDATVGMSIQGRTKGDIEFTNQAAQHTLRLIQNAGSGRNYITIENNITSAGPTISALGQTDTNIDINIIPLGAGLLNIVNTAMELNEIATPTAPGAALAQIYVKDVAARSHLFIQDDVGEVDLQLGASPLTTKGDIFGYDTGDARIPVGTNGQVLTANSAVALGVEWAAAAGGEFNGPYTADTDFATFDINNVGVLNFSLTGPTGLPAATEPYISFEDAGVPDAILINVPTGAEVQISMNAVEEYNWSATEFNLHNNILQAAGNIFQSNLSAVGITQFGRSNEITGQDVSDIRFNAGNTRYAEIIVNMVSAVAGSEIGDIDFLIKNDNTTTMDSVLTLVGGATATAARINLGAPIGTNLDMDDNLLLNVNQIRSDGTIANAGYLRLKNLDLLAWRNVGNTANHSITFNASDQFVISVTSGNDYLFSETTLFMAGNFIQSLGEIQDVNGNAQLDFSATVGSAVNHITISNAATGTPPLILAEGDDANIDLEFRAKGEGSIIFADNDGNEELLQLIQVSGAATNFVEITNSLTANGPIIAAQGTTNVDLNIQSKGTGIINLNNDVLAAGDVVITHRLQGAKGADVASATTITLVDGNLFDITGTTQIDAMTSTNWQAGSVVILHFDDALTVTHNTGANGFFLAGAASFVTTADDTLTVVWNGTRWEEISRSIN